MLAYTETTYWPAFVPPNLWSATVKFNGQLVCRQEGAAEVVPGWVRFEASENLPDVVFNMVVFPITHSVLQSTG